MRTRQPTLQRRLAAIALIPMLIAGCAGSGAATSPPVPASTAPSAAVSTAPSSAPSGSAGTGVEEPGPPETATLSLATRTGNIGSVAPFYIAIDKGFYAEEGLTVEGVIITDQVLEGITGGSINIGIFDPDRTIDAVNEGVPLKMVAGNRQRQPFIIATAAGIDEPEDLRGKAVALGSGVGDPESEIRLKALKDIGWDLQALDVQFVQPPGGSDGRVELLLNDQLALTYVFPRHKKPITEAGGTLLIDDYQDPYLNDVAVVREDWMTDNPDTLVRFLRATIRGKQIWVDLSQKDYVLGVMAKYGFEVGDAQREEYDFDPVQHDPDMAIPREGYDLMVELTGVDDPGYDNIVDLTYLHQAQALLGLPER